MENASDRILSCKVGYNSVSDLDGRTVAFIRTKKTNAGRVAQMQRGQAVGANQGQFSAAHLGASMAFGIQKILRKGLVHWH